MIRFYLTSIIFFAACYFGHGQQVMNIESFQPKLNYDNVHVYEMDSDSNLSSFLIWVKKEVKAHKHEYHTELVYVLEGEGEFSFHYPDGVKSQIVKSGDYIFIPENTIHSVKVKSQSAMKVMSVQTPFFDGTDRVLIGE